MTREDIIRMAREAGMKFSPAQFSGVLEAEIDEFSLETLVALVRADEREIFCAVLRQLHDSYSLQSDPPGNRARGQA